MAVDGKSSDIQKNQIDKLEKLFPEAVSEGKVDFAKLRATLGESVDMSERYTLSWKGKKDVFAAIQERTTKTLKPSREESVDYDTTENLFIEGDNLEVLKVLQDSYYGKIKMIYIDPPYNTGNDFVYNDKFAEKRAEYEEAQNGTRSDGLMKNTKDKGHYHSNWLNMMYPRLYVARNLLRKDGVIFVSIDDNEVHNLRLIMNEIFGEENFVDAIIWKKTENIKMDSRFLSQNKDYILCYRRSEELSEFNKELSDIDRFNLEDSKGKYYLRKLDSKSSAYRPTLDYTIENRGVKYYPGGSEEKWNERQKGNVGAYAPRWLWSKKKFEDGLIEGNIVFRNGGVYNKVRYDGVANKPFTNMPILVSGQTAQKELDDLLGARLFDHPKPPQLIQWLENLIVHDENSIILDFFSGSATTADAVMRANVLDYGMRKHIQVQLPELLEINSDAYRLGHRTIADIAKERIRRAGKKIVEENADKLKDRKTPLDIGFKVLKLDDSNFKAWNTDIEDEEQLKEQIQAHLDPIVDGAREEDLLLELMLKSGYRPTDKVEQRDGYYLVSNTDVGKTAISLAHEMTEELYTQILATKPTKILLLDRSLTSSSLKTNLLLQAKHANIDLEVV